MSLFKKKFCLFSNFEGTLMFDGKPASGAKITRKMSIDRSYEFKIEEEVTADEKGEFSFPSYWDKVNVPLLGEFHVRQEVLVSYKGEEYFIWRHSKRFPEEYADFAGTYRDLTCEITDGIRRVKFDHNYIYTSHTNCRWEIVEKIEL